MHCTDREKININYKGKCSMDGLFFPTESMEKRRNHDKKGAGE
jgi:hypothetical protein